MSACVCFTKLLLNTDVLDVVVIVNFYLVLTHKIQLILTCAYMYMTLYFVFSCSVEFSSSGSVASDSSHFKTA